MKLENIRKLSSGYPGGLKALAADSGMTEVAMHRSLGHDKMWAHNLESIARNLGVPVAVFFDEDVGVKCTATEVNTRGDSSPAVANGDVNQTNITQGDNGTVNTEASRLSHRDKEQLRKDELIRSLRREVADLRKMLNDKDVIISLLSGKQT